MKLRKLLLGLAALSGMSVFGAAYADHVHGRVGIYLGVPSPIYGYPYPYRYPYPYYYPYYQPLIVTPPPPPVYIERSAPAAQGGNYWYHCDNPEGYYPYVKACPGGWQTVVPSPPPR